MTPFPPSPVALAGDAKKPFRSLLAACAIAAALASLGCPKSNPDDKKQTGGPSASGNAEATKLAKDVVGRWANDKASYAFREGGDYEYKGGDLTIKGKWKALDGKQLEMTFTLTKAQVEALKPVFDLAKKGIDEVNNAAKKAADASGGLIKFEPLPYPPEPKEGDNTWKESVTVKGETAEISGAKYTKRIGTPGPFEQTAKFRAEVAGTGQIYFPIPYAEPPEVDLKRFAGPVQMQITDLQTTGFKWTNTSKDRMFGNTTEYTFVAKGIPTDKDKTPFVQNGEFKATLGAKGEEKFPAPFASPPNVELTVDIGLHEVVVTETTAEGFKWKNVSTDKIFPDKKMKYAAKGVKGK